MDRWDKAPQLQESSRSLLSILRIYTRPTVRVIDRGLYISQAKISPWVSATLFECLVRVYDRD